MRRAAGCARSRSPRSKSASDFGWTSTVSGPSPALTRKTGRGGQVGGGGDAERRFEADRPLAPAPVGLPAAHVETEAGRQPARRLRAPALPAARAEIDQLHELPVAILASSREGRSSQRLRTPAEQRKLAQLQVHPPGADLAADQLGEDIAVYGRTLGAAEVHVFGDRYRRAAGRPSQGRPGGRRGPPAGLARPRRSAVRAPAAATPRFPGSSRPSRRRADRDPVRARPDAAPADPPSVSRAPATPSTTTTAAIAATVSADRPSEVTSWPRPREGAGRA